MSPGPRHRAVRRSSRQPPAELGLRRRHLLLETTLELIGETSNASPRVADIVERAGISRAGFYELFASKDDLLRAVYEVGTNHIGRNLEKSMRNQLPLEQVATWIERFLGEADDPVLASRHRPFVLEHFGLMASHSGIHDVGSPSLLNPLYNAIIRAIETGDIPSDTDPEESAIFIYRMTTYYFYQLIALGRRPPHSEVTALVNFALRGLGAATSNQADEIQRHWSPSANGPGMPQTTE